MESELSGIFRVKLVTKNIVRGSPETQFMHMRVKPSIKLICNVNSILSQCMIVIKKLRNLVTFTEEILNGKLHFLCSVLVNS